MEIDLDLALYFLISAVTYLATELKNYLVWLRTSNTKQKAIEDVTSPTPIRAIKIVTIESSDNPIVSNPTVTSTGSGEMEQDSDGDCNVDCDPVDLDDPD